MCVLLFVSWILPECYEEWNVNDLCENIFKKLAMVCLNMIMCDVRNFIHTTNFRTNLQIRIVLYPFGKEPVSSVIEGSRSEV
jgi:hypothetical protein